MMSDSTSALRILSVATSYPRSTDDWQGLFIQRLVDALAAKDSLQASLWAPPGPLAAGVSWAGTESDADFLTALAGGGGIAHQLRQQKIRGGMRALELLRRLRALYRRSDHELIHVHWLQNALPLLGLGRRVVVSVLGTDFAMLKLPGMVSALRRVFASNSCVLTPNAPWMADELERHFGDIASVVPVNFGIDDVWYSLEQETVDSRRDWLCVSRVTEGKIGDLFDWGGDVFHDGRCLTLVGPNQGGLTIPGWVNYEGSATPQDIASVWFPRATGLVSLSKHAEGRPQVMLEAMAAGLPVIASSLPAHLATIIDGKTGFLVDSRAAFVDAMNRLDDPGRRLAFGAQARETARDTFGLWSDCANRFEQVYRSLL